MSLQRVQPGQNFPDDINVIVEVPMNSPAIKYEVDKDSGAIFVDRMLKTAMYYPCNYGYVPHTLCGDGDPVDVLVVLPLPMLPGTVDFSAALVATYSRPVTGGDLSVTWETFHQGASPGFGDFSLEPIMLDEFTLSNLRVGYDSSDNWSMTVWVNNVFDTFYYKGVAPADGIIAPHYFGFSEPRRVGLDIGYKF